MKRFLALLASLALLLALPALAEEDWYLETARELAAQLGELAQDETYLELFGMPQDVSAAIEPFCAADYSSSVLDFRINLPIDAFFKLYDSFSDSAGLSGAGLERMRAFIPSMLITGYNNAQGVEHVAAASVLNFSRGYPMPEGFSPCIYVLQFDSATVAVAFAQSGDATISATAYPLFTGEDASLAGIAAGILGALPGEGS